MTILILILLLYVLPAFGCYWYIHIAYGPNGVEKHGKPNGKDAFLMLCPILNIIVNVAWLSESPYDNRFALFENWSWTKFFRIKK